MREGRGPCTRHRVHGYLFFLERYGKRQLDREQGTGNREAHLDQQANSYLYKRGSWVVDALPSSAACSDVSFLADLCDGVGTRKNWYVAVRWRVCCPLIPAI